MGSIGKWQFFMRTHHDLPEHKRFCARCVPTTAHRYETAKRLVYSYNTCARCHRPGLTKDECTKHGNGRCHWLDAEGKCDYKHSAGSDGNDKTNGGAGGMKIGSNIRERTCASKASQADCEKLVNCKWVGTVCTVKPQEEVNQFWECDKRAEGEGGLTGILTDRILEKIKKRMEKGNRVKKKWNRVKKKWKRIPTAEGTDEGALFPGARDPF